MTDVASDLLVRSDASEALIEKLIVRKLNFYYSNGNHALIDVSMPVFARKVTALMGPSGCGKSTLLRVFNRIYDLYRGQRVEGEVLFEGENLLTRKRRIEQVRERIGMVFQMATPFPMSIYDNVAFGVRVWQRLSHADIDVQVEQALRQAALWDEVKDNLAGSGLSLSGGQQQRLCIARAIALHPDILLLDEPCSALDPGSSAMIEQTIHQLKEHCTVVIVTHNLQQAARVSDFAAFMYLGQMIEFDSVQRMFTAPKDPRTKSFVTGQAG